MKKNGSVRLPIAEAEILISEHPLMRSPDRVRDVGADGNCMSGVRLHESMQNTGSASDQIREICLDQAHLR